MSFSFACEIGSGQYRTMTITSYWRLSEIRIKRWSCLYFPKVWLPKASVFPFLLWNCGLSQSVVYLQRFICILIYDAYSIRAVRHLCDTWNAMFSTGRNSKRSWRYETLKFLWAESWEFRRRYHTFERSWVLGAELAAAAVCLKNVYFRKSQIWSASLSLKVPDDVWQD